MNEELELRPLRARMSLRTDFIFYPVDGNDFAQIIKKRGYELKEAPQTMGPFRVEFPGHLAEKDGNQVILDTNRQILAVDGQDPETIISIFSELEEIINEEMNIEYGDNIRFYETVVDYHVYTEKNPRTIIEKASRHDETAEAFTDMLGKPVSLFTLRYASKGTLPNSPEWIDVRLEPFVRRADKVYSFNLVHRSLNRDSVKDTLANVEIMIKKLVEKIQS
ncbi:MAG: hypothetical protein JRJ66_16705 [Deltaproteobacteria bacterium]|nr:hypothetical protein [Deltaproteobacteria bacterium]